MPPDNDLAQAAAETIEGLPSGQTPPEPVNVELPPEDGQSLPEKKETEAAPQKRGRPTNERIATLVGDKRSLMQELETERRRSAELAASLQAKEQELTAGQVRQMELHKARLTSEAERARNDYEAAFNAQDPKKQADATAKLARSESGLADVEAWEARNKTERPEPQQREQPQQQQQRPQPQVDPATATWMTENPWFQPGSAEFDRSMHLTAVAYAARVEDRMRAEGREKEIAGTEYWDDINQYMAREFPDRYDMPDEPETKVAPAQRASSPVVPATRTQPQTAGTRTATGGKVLTQLSGSERAMADQLRSSGALVYPADHPKVLTNPALSGKRMAPEDAYIAYGTQIRRDKADQAQRRANQ